MVAFEWTVRDVLQGKRGVVLAGAAAIPAAFVMLIALTVEPIPPDEAEEITAIFLTTFVFPGLTSVLAIVAAGAVLRQPLEDGTAIYLLTRAESRLRIGATRTLAVGLIVGAVAVLTALLLAPVTQQWREVLGALGGLFLGGVAFGCAYGFLVSLHRFAWGATLLHAVFESFASRIPFGIREWTISYHAWGAMGRVTDLAASDGVVPDDDGTFLVPVLVALVAIAASAWYYRRRGFNLSVTDN